MKIAVLSVHLPNPQRTKSGGVAHITHRMANGLAERGHSVTVFSTDPPPPYAAYDVQQLSVRFSHNVYRNWLMYWRLSTEFSRQDYEQFDLIHSHGDEVFLHDHRKPVVRTVHGTSADEAVHAITVRKRLWYLTLIPKEIVEVRRATVSVAVSHNTRKRFPSIDYVIPNPIDRTVFYADPEKALRPTILFVGTLVARKRGQMLVDIFRTQIQPRMPDAQLWLVSESGAEGPGITWFNSPNDQELAELYRKAWVFCLPSTYEGFGVPYIEAMACGLPVVATPNPGACEITEDGKWGVLTEADYLGATLLSLLRDDHLRRAFRRLGLCRAERFNLERVLDAYEHVYREAIERQRRLSL